MLGLVRAYRIGQARFLRWCFEALGDDGGDARVRAEATRRMTELSFTDIDRMSEQFIAVYEQERERWLHNRGGVTRVRSVLAVEEEVDVDATESTLGYRLLPASSRRRRLGRRPTGCDDDPVALERASRSSPRRSAVRPRRCSCPMTSRPHGRGSRWTRDAPERQVLEPVADPGVRVALGEPEDGVEGFRRTHRQALLAQGSLSPPGPTAIGSPRSPTSGRSR